LKNWILQHLPEHKFYAEPFAGAASILLAKSPAPGGEIINDMNEEVVNLFQVMRDERLSSRLIQLLQWTPYAHSELKVARDRSPDPVERARRMAVRSFMGITPAGHEDSCATGLRMGGVQLSTLDQSGKRTFRNCARDWQNWKENINAIRDRLSNVMIYQKDALEFMADMDSPECLQYVDPPYCHLSRSESRYAVDFDRHDDLVKFAIASKSMMVISGYDSHYYDMLELCDWTKVVKDYRANMSANRRTECLWINPLAVRKLSEPRESTHR
jgi:DNA adenine methylase